MVSLLQSKWFKLCDDFVSNEIVQFHEQVLGRFGLSDFLKSYIEHEMNLEALYLLQVRRGKCHNFRVILQPIFPTVSDTVNAFNCPTSVTECAKTCRAQEYRHLMFVPTREVTNDMQRMCICFVPSIVRLESTDQLSDIQGDLPYETRHSLFLKARLADKDRKLMLGTRPPQIIQNGIQIMDNISSNKSQMNGNTLNYFESVARHVFIPFNMNVSDGLIWIQRKKVAGLSVKVLDVFPCPTDPLTGNIDTLRCDILRQEVYSQYEEITKARYPR